ncbi:MAG: methyltransferase domain-containing protein [Bacteroidetes bacterium]|nr:methyltransferase domain-containing protein [Bacteroidota bacterium]
MPSHSRFDAAAINYDTDFTYSEIGKMQRACVYSFLEKNILSDSPLSILEINCGTGEDAVWFANKGNQVIATDGSTNMIEVSRKKIPALNMGSVSFEQAAFSELKSKYKHKKFDFLFSNFGGLNCVSELELKNLLNDFSNMLKPHGKLVLVIMGRKCLWERFYFLLKGKNQSAFRRSSKTAVPAQIGQDVTQATYYYSPTEIKKMIPKNIHFKTCKPIGISIPPSYLEPFFKSKKVLLKLLNAKEKLLSRISLLSDYADHYLIYFEKKAENKST